MLVSGCGFLTAFVNAFLYEIFVILVTLGARGVHLGAGVAEVRVAVGVAGCARVARSCACWWASVVVVLHGTRSIYWVHVISRVVTGES